MISRSLEDCSSTVLYQGHEVPIQHQKPPGLQSEMDPAPVSEQLPTPEGGYMLYKAAGKLEGKKALITGGDSGIGRSIAILFAMEGADSFIAYLPDEEKDAQTTKARVNHYGRNCHLMATDLKNKENCKKVVETAIAEMGAINILVNNHAYQMMVNDIADLTEYAFRSCFCFNHFLTSLKLEINGNLLSTPMSIHSSILVNIHFLI